MIRLLSCLIVTCFASSALAGIGISITPFPGPGNIIANAPVGDSCGTDGLIFAWHMEDVDVTAGTPSGCALGDTTATLQSGATIATTQVYDGTYALFGDGTSARADFTNTLDIISEGKVSARVYVGTGEYVDFLIVFEASVDTSNRIRLELAPAGSNTDIRPQLSHIGGGTTDLVTMGNTGRAEGTWFYVEAGWIEETAAGNDMYIKVCDADGVSNCTTVEADNDPVASTGTPSIVSWGSNSSATLLKAGSGVDYGKVWTTSGY